MWADSYEMGWTGSTDRAQGMYTKLGFENTNQEFSSGLKMEAVSFAFLEHNLR
jgi:hypothetical protein